MYQIKKTGFQPHGDHRDTWSHLLHGFPVDGSRFRYPGTPIRNLVRPDVKNLHIHLSLIYSVIMVIYIYTVVYNDIQ